MVSFSQRQTFPNLCSRALPISDNAWMEADAPQFQTPDGDSAEPEPPAAAAEAGSGEAHVVSMLIHKSGTPVCSLFCLFAVFGGFFFFFGRVFAILFEVPLAEAQEEIHRSAGWEGGGVKWHENYEQTFCEQTGVS